MMVYYNHYLVMTEIKLRFKAASFPAIVFLYIEYRISLYHFS